MAPPIRILHLEDNAGDRLLVRSVFEAEGIDCDFVLADTREQFAAALNGGTYDLILSDYALPTFDGITALQMVRKRNSDLPFIFVSGTMGEELAIEMLKAGATDYVLKERLSRLIPSVRRALEEARERREKHEAKTAHQESEERFGLLVGGVKDYAILMLDPEGHVASWNEGAQRIKGYRADEVIGKHFSCFYPSEDVARGKPGRDVRIAAAEGRFEDEGWRVRKDGTRFWANVVLTALRGEGGDLRGFAQVTRDVTERKKAEEALRESEEKYRSMVETTKDWIWSADLKGRITYSNQATEAIMGFRPEELVGADFNPLVHPDDLRGVEQLLGRCVQERSSFTGFVLRMRHKDGSYRQVEGSGVPILGKDGRVLGFRGATRDITERVLLEAQLRQSQKMEAIGTLAGGVAHDFNNLLTTILGYSELVLDGIEPSSPLREDVQEIQKAGERAASLTRQLLAFSRKQVLAPVDLDLNAVVADMERMLRRLIGEDVSLAASLSPDLWSVRADAGQIEQVIVNLVVNARDAMPHGGKVTIETRNYHLDDSYIRTHAYVQPGQHVCLSVSDTGTGMDGETRARIFEPFFTTKGPGKGTGLGLSTVYGIIKQGGGSIEVYSEPGRGTSFKVYLPRVSAAQESAALEKRRPAAGGSETVLLVEDEEAVRRLARVVIEKMGYTVLEAASAEEAFSVAASHAGEIGLLLTDSVMPGMSGPDLARILRVERPKTRVLFMSGYTDDAIVRHGLLEPHEAFLQKPFSPDVLARKIREVLDAGAP